MTDKPENNSSEKLKSLLLADDISIGISKRIERIPLRKPSGFFRSLEIKSKFRLLGLEDEKDGTLYFLDPSFSDLKISNLRAYLLVPYADRYNNLFVWPIKLPKSGQQQGLTWSESAIAAANESVNNWIKIEANKLTHTYDIFCAEGIENKPNWSNHTDEEIILKATSSVFINSREHDVIKRLEGKI